MALTVVWEKAAVVKETRDSDGKVVATEEVIVNRGEELPDFVSDFQRSVMVSIGAARDLGQAVAVVQNAVDEVQAAMEPPAPPVLPPEIPPVRPVQAPATAPVATTDPTATEPAPAPTTVTGDTSTLQRPADNARKDVWEDYAVAKGYATREEAESLTKVKLIDQVDRREQA